MLTLFGKFCRKLRIDNGELLKDMADRLGVTPSYLSAVEMGKRNIPADWSVKIAEIFSLDIKAKRELQDAIQESQSTLKFDLQQMRQTDKNIVLAFARELKSLNDDDKKRIQNILNKKGGNL